MVLILPLLKPILQFDIVGNDLTYENLVLALHNSINRSTFRWALKEKLKSAPGNIPFEGILKF